MKSNEKSYLGEDERRRAQMKDEEELKKEQEAILRVEKKKEINREEEVISDDLGKLRDLLEAHIIDDSLIEKVIDHGELDSEEIEKIFEKIDEIEALDNIDDYLPKDMRVTKEEYAEATHNDDMLITVLAKIDSSLSIIMQNSTQQSGGSVNIFSGFLTMLDKNLITIQEHHIDMQDSLRNNKKVSSESLWETIKKSFR